MIDKELAKRLAKCFFWMDYGKGNWERYLPVCVDESGELLSILRELDPEFKAGDFY